jgi:hypothetical protein
MIAPVSDVVVVRLVQFGLAQMSRVDTAIDLLPRVVACLPSGLQSDVRVFSYREDILLIRYLQRCRQSFVPVRRTSRWKRFEPVSLIGFASGFACLIRKSVRGLIRKSGYQDGVTAHDTALMPALCPAQREFRRMRTNRRSG